MIVIIFGILFILAGITIGLLALMAAGMADRETTAWENTYRPLLWFIIPVIIGVLLIVLRNY